MTQTARGPVLCHIWLPAPVFVKDERYDNNIATREAHFISSQGRAEAREATATLHFLSLESLGLVSSFFSSLTFHLPSVDDAGSLAAVVLSFMTSGGMRSH